MDSPTIADIEPAVSIGSQADESTTSNTINESEE
jgi:hypothetical protein